MSHHRNRNQKSSSNRNTNKKYRNNNNNQNASKHLHDVKHFIQKNDYNSITKLFDDNPSLVNLLGDTMDARGSTLLHFSVLNNSLELFKYLLELFLNACFHIDIKKRDTGMTMLHLACKANRYEFVSLLINNGAFINSKDKKGNTPLHYAVINKNTDLIKLLIECGSMITIKNRKGQKPFHLLKQVVDSIESSGFLDRSQQQMVSHYKEVLDYYFECHNYCKKFGSDMQLCIEKDDHNTLMEILENNEKSRFINSTLTGKSALYIAVEKRSDECIDILLDHGANPQIHNIVNDSLFHRAIELGSESAMSSLLYHNALLHIRDKEGNLPLDICVKQRMWNLVEAILEKHIEQITVIDSVPTHLKPKFNWVFRKAIKDGQIGVVVTMLKKYKLVDPNYTTSSRWAPLHLAIKFMHLNIMKVLVNNGANVNQELVNGFMPLHMIAELDIPDKEKAQFLRVVLKKGAKVNALTKDNYAAIHMLCRKNQPESIQAISKFRANLNLTHPFRSSPYYIAMESKNFDVVKALISNGVNCDGSDDFSPLFDAVRKGYVDVVETMLENNVDVNWVERETQWSILGMSVLKELDGSIIKKMIECGADLSAKNSYGYTPLHTAVSMENTSLVRILLDHGASPDEPNNNGYCPIHTALTLRNLNVINLLTEYQVDLEVPFPNSDILPIQAVLSIPGAENFPEQLLSGHNMNALLIRALLAGNIKLASQMLSKGANPNGHQNDQDINYYQMPLSILARQNPLNVEMIKFMLDNRADPNQILSGKQRALIHFAVDLKSVSLITLLLKNNYRVNINVTEISGWSPLHIALAKYSKSNEEDKLVYLSIIKLLIENGADLSQPTNEGIVPLHQAVSSDSLELVKEFISLGVNVNEKTKWKISALDLAVRKKFWDIAMVLVEAGANEIKSHIRRSSWTLLHSLALEEYKNEYLPLYEVLCKKIDINEPDSNGWSPIHVAIMNDNIDMINLFLQHGADPSQSTNRGFTPLHTIARIIPRIHKPESTHKEGRKYTHDNILSIYDLIIDQAVDVNAVDENDYTPLDVAMFNNNKTISERLLTRGAQLRRYRKGTELHQAVENNNANALSMFSGSDIDDCQGYNQWTPLHLATWKEFEQCVIELLKMGSAVMKQDRIGRTALHLAGIKQNQRIFDHLLMKGGEELRNVKDHSGKLASYYLHETTPVTPSIEKPFATPAPVLDTSLDIFDWADADSDDNWVYNPTEEMTLSEYNQTNHQQRVYEDNLESFASLFDEW
eukprot:TRINITY_DN13348_c0_g1_i1.p1 TRINITY_DN13348_c0_g1~~TRINITY_DN13348_c0_g1_i1.p1  ORF type:complete len:1253 (-),score=225.09 TRINITY_DN13348_c0_g1_i1:25-3783(-)